MNYFIGYTKFYKFDLNTFFCCKYILKRFEPKIVRFQKHKLCKGTLVKNLGMLWKSDVPSLKKIHSWKLSILKNDDNLWGFWFFFSSTTCICDSWQCCCVNTSWDIVIKLTLSFSWIRERKFVPCACPETCSLFFIE